jgi:hypothetical protein
MRAMMWGAIAIFFACLFGCATSYASNLHSKVGAHATVSPRYAPQFQALIDDLERHGAQVRFMGGYRSGYCGQASKHPCGMALDVCQLARGVVDRRCHLPGRVAMGEIARRHNLFSGGDWCNSDYGHVEAGTSVACGHSWASNGGSKHEGHHYRTVARAVEYASVSVKGANPTGPGGVNFH